MTQSLETLPECVALKPVEAGDEEFLLGVYASTRTEELAQVSWNESQRAAFLRMQFEAQTRHYRENYPGAEFQIIWVEGERAGRLYVHRRSGEIRIMDIALLPLFRNRGIGTRLLEAILAEGETSQRRVTIHVEGFNPALRLYERLGFKRMGVNGPYFLMEWTPSP